MCGIAGIVGRDWQPDQLEAMVASQRHRGPDADGIFESASSLAGLGHNRLSIIDLSDAGRQPMSDPTGRYWIVFNGEIYNYVELRAELEGRYFFRSRTDTEVLLAAFLIWGESCLDRLIGMFAFLVWDEKEQKLFGARDRFGVKPLHYHVTAAGGLWLTSEIKALHAAGVPRRPNPHVWATYLASGMYDGGKATFWEGISRILPGGCFTWSPECGFQEKQWYDPASIVLETGPDTRPEPVVTEELLTLLEDSVTLRLRSDVAVGVCLSGGLDSSLLLGLVHRIQGPDSSLKSFTFYCGDPAYDEIPWVERLLARTKHPALFCRLTVEEVPSLAARVQRSQDEPFGGLPTLGMAKVHERAAAEGVVVLLDGNGLDEGWAGYDYYQNADRVEANRAPVQGSQDPSTRPACLTSEFAALATGTKLPNHLADPVCAIQYRDLCFAKIPRAMRFADRVSMMHSRELREPFLDHRVIELGLRQPKINKLRNGQGKYLVRQVAAGILPQPLHEAPKRPVQTPQREWLRGPLREWADACIESALEGQGSGWLQPELVRSEWARYCSGVSDNSFFVWQWISLGLIERREEIVLKSRRFASRKLMSTLSPNNSADSTLKLSIVIRCRNEAAGLRKVFSALRAQQCDFPWEVILVDNESEDETQQVAQEFGARIVPITRREFTYGRAINVGVSSARGELVMLLSAHALPIGSYFLASATAPFADPQMAAVRCLAADQRQLEYWYQPKDLQYQSAEEQRNAESGSAWLREYPTAACCVIRRKVWEEVKYDETIEANEDKLWASHVLARGYKIRCCAEAIWLHTRKYGKKEERIKTNREHLALYRITGRAPLSFGRYLRLTLRTFAGAPRVALRHVIDNVAWNTYLVSIPWQARRTPKIGSVPEFDLKPGKELSKSSDAAPTGVLSSASIPTSGPHGNSSPTRAPISNANNSHTPSR